MTTLDPGHKYLLPSLDGIAPQTLTFVKRCDIRNPHRFPGNTNSYPGTTIQNVLRALLKRLRYLQRQVWCVENVIIIYAIRVSLWLMEFRASRRHGKLYLHSLPFAEKAQMCPLCFHTDCHHTP